MKMSTQYIPRSVVTISSVSHSEAEAMEGSTHKLRKMKMNLNKITPLTVSFYKAIQIVIARKLENTTLYDRKFYAAVRIFMQPILIA